MNKYIIKNTTILTMNKDKDVIENGVVVVEDSLIKEIGESRLQEKYKEWQVIDGEGGILIPGMVNTHTHVSMMPFRSLADDCKDRLKKYIFPLEKKYVNREFVYKSARYGICEMLLGGVTSFCDMYFFEDEVAKAAKEIGIRGVLGETVLDFPSPDSKDAYGGIEYSKWFIEKWKDDELIIPAIAPHAPYTNSSEKLQEAHSVAKEFDVPMVMHVAEMRFETEKYEKEYNMSPVKYLDSLGILDSKFIAAHSVLVDSDDIKILADRGVKVAHNMGANTKGAKGVAPILDMMKENMDIGLGSDGAMSGNTIDIITQMPLVAKVQKLHNNDRSVLEAKEILELATIGGARVLGMGDKTGSIEVGKKADIVIVETDSVNMYPIHDYYSAIVYSANPSNVDTVIVDGEVKVRNKKLQNVDYREERAQLNKIIETFEV